jgi:hypothetical protein
LTEIQDAGTAAYPHPSADYGFVEVSDEWWLIVEVVAVEPNRVAAWQALWLAFETDQFGCVIEFAPGRWAACRGFRCTLLPELYDELHALPAALQELLATHA